MKIYEIIMGLIFLIFLILLLIFITIPIWADSKKVCKYWENQNNNMVCIQEEIVFCLGKC